MCRGACATTRTRRRQLGRFNGAYLTERPLPAAEWLSRDWLRSWLAEGAAAIDELPRHRAHPLVGRIYPADQSAELKNLWKCRDILLAALDRLPPGPLPPGRVPAQSLLAIGTAVRRRLGLPRRRAVERRAR